MGPTMSDFNVKDGSTLHLIELRGNISSYSEMASNGVMCVFVRTLSEDVIECRLKPSDTVKDLKIKIKDTEFIPPADQRLLFVGRGLDDLITT